MFNILVYHLRAKCKCNLNSITWIKHSVGGYKLFFDCVLFLDSLVELVWETNSAKCQTMPQCRRQGTRALMMAAGLWYMTALVSEETCREWWPMLFYSSAFFWDSHKNQYTLSTICSSRNCSIASNNLTKLVCLQAGKINSHLERS